VQAVAQRQLVVQIQYFIQSHHLVAEAVANEVLTESLAVLAAVAEMTAILVALEPQDKVLLEEMVMYPVMVRAAVAVLVR
jgi:Mlc titration factor MtfA (ptsG expression regulator)